MEAIKIIGKVVEISNGIKIVPINEQNLEAISKKIEEESDVPIMVNFELVKKVYAFGDTAGTSVGSEEYLSHYIKKIIPNVEITIDKVVKHSYKCFAGIPTFRNNIIQHEDAGSAINCLMSVLKEPQRVLIFS